MTGFDYYFLCIGIIIIPVIIARFIMEKAQKNLSAEMKLKLIDTFSERRKYSLLIVAGLILVMYLLIKFIPGHSLLITICFLLTILILYLIRNIQNNKKLKELGAPEEYMKKLRVSALIIGSGFIIYIIVLLFQGNLSRAGNNAQGPAYKGYTLMGEKKYQDAVDEFTKAIAEDSTQASYYTNRGTSYYYLHDNANACLDWRKAQLLGDQAAAEYANAYCK